MLLTISCCWHLTMKHSIRRLNPFLLSNFNYDRGREPIPQVVVTVATIYHNIRSNYMNVNDIIRYAKTSATQLSEHIWLTVNFMHIGLCQYSNRCAVFHSCSFSPRHYTQRVNNLHGSALYLSVELGVDDQKPVTMFQNQGYAAQKNCQKMPDNIVTLSVIHFALPTQSFCDLWT